MQPVAGVDEPAVGRDQDLRAEVAPGKPGRQSGDRLSGGQPAHRGVVVEERVAERGVGFRRPIVHFEGLARESPGLEERFVRREDARLPAAEHVVAVSETRV